MGLDVIGAGFGRTGTMSLKRALEQLDLGPCHHMAELFIGPDPQGLTAKWLKVAEGESIDWDEVFAGYRSTVDWPSTAYWRELADRYPDAKVILTLRDADGWFDSTQATIFKPGDVRLTERTDPWARMVVKVINQNTFDGDVTDRDHCIGIFERHNDEVRRTIPPERLLVYEAAEGWEPLCRFLGVPVPDAPFPATNTTEEFQTRVAARAAEKAAAELVNPASPAA